MLQELQGEVHPPYQDCLFPTVVGRGCTVAAAAADSVVAAGTAWAAAFAPAGRLWRQWYAQRCRHEHFGDGVEDAQRGAQRAAPPPIRVQHLLRPLVALLQTQQVARSTERGARSHPKDTGGQGGQQGAGGADGGPGSRCPTLTAATHASSSIRRLRRRSTLCTQRDMATSACWPRPSRSPCSTLRSRWPRSAATHPTSVCVGAGAAQAQAPASAQHHGGRGGCTGRRQTTCKLLPAEPRASACLLLVRILWQEQVRATGQSVDQLLRPAHWLEPLAQ